MHTLTIREYEGTAYTLHVFIHTYIRQVWVVYTQTRTMRVIISSQLQQTYSMHNLKSITKEREEVNLRE